jgi:hypothetical protein
MGKNMADPQKKRIKAEEFFSRVLVELPALSASEMEQGHFVQKKLFLETDLDAELTALRIWYLSQALFGSLVHRGGMDPELALDILRRLMLARDRMVGPLKLDFKSRCEFYERAMQHDMEDEGHGNALLDCFCQFCGSDHAAIKELYYAAMVGITTRLAKTAERFEVE